MPAVPALLLAICSIRGHEKSWYGEVAAAVTFACLAMPLSMAAGAAVPWLRSFPQQSAGVTLNAVKVCGLFRKYGDQHPYNRYGR